MKQKSLFKQWSAVVPIVMSLASLGLVVYFFTFAGAARQEDEGTPAHVYQLLMMLELPIIGWFGLRWLPRRFKEALVVLAVQSGAWLAALVALFIAESGLNY